MKYLGLIYRTEIVIDISIEIKDYKKLLRK